MIEVSRLTKRYRDLVAVDDLSFTVGKGEVVGFLGPNGAGKSTTMRILTGFLPATSGTARVAGFDVFEEPLEVKRRIGYLPEQPPVYDALTPRSYLRFCASLKGLDRRRVKDEIDRVAERTGVAQVMDRVIGNLSKGFRQRVGLAQALLGDPEVLVLDEPTVGLDPLQIREVRELVKSLAGRHTVILSTHILPEVAMTCQKVLVIHQGRLVDFDTVEGLIARHLPGRRVTDPWNKPVAQVVTLPDTAMLDPLQSRQFVAFGRTEAGESIAVTVRWTASGGTITAAGLYTAQVGQPGAWKTLAFGGVAVLGNGLSFLLVERAQKIKSASGWRTPEHAAWGDFMLKNVASRDFSVSLVLFALFAALDWFLMFAAAGSLIFACVMLWVIRPSAVAVTKS